MQVTARRWSVIGGFIMLLAGSIPIYGDVKKHAPQIVPQDGAAGMKPIGNLFFIQATRRKKMQTYSKRIERHMVNFYRSHSEKDRRRYAAVEAEKLGHGGVAYIANLFKCDPDTVSVGRDDVEQLPDDAASGRVRKKGGGRKTASSADPQLVPLLEQAVENHVAGSPVDPEIK